MTPNSQRWARMFSKANFRHPVVAWADPTCAGVTDSARQDAEVRVMVRANRLGRPKKVRPPLAHPVSAGGGRRDHLGDPRWTEKLALVNP